MLNRREEEVMKVVYTLCKEEGKCLVSPWELLNMLPSKRNYTEEKLEKILSALQFDGYFDRIDSDRKGEKMYVLILRNAGFAYSRTQLQARRDILFKVFLSVGGAIIAFLFGLILKAIFKN